MNTTMQDRPFAETDVTPMLPAAQEVETAHERLDKARARYRALSSPNSSATGSAVAEAHEAYNRAADDFVRAIQSAARSEVV